MNLGFYRRLVGDLPENQMCAQPHGLLVAHRSSGGVRHTAPRGSGEPG